MKQMSDGIPIYRSCLLTSIFNDVILQVPLTLVVHVDGGCSSRHILLFYFIFPIFYSEQELLCLTFVVPQCVCLTIRCSIIDENGFNVFHQGQNMCKIVGPRLNSEERDPSIHRPSKGPGGLAHRFHYLNKRSFLKFHIFITVQKGSNLLLWEVPKRPPVKVKEKVFWTQFQNHGHKRSR